MKLITLVEHRLRIMLKKRWILVFIILFPMIFCAMTLFLFKPKEALMPIAIVNEDNGVESNRIIGDLITDKVFNVSILTRENAMKSLEMEKVQIVYIFTKEFYNKIKIGDVKNSLEIHYISGNKLEGVVTENIAAKLMPYICSNEAGNFTKKFYSDNNIHTEDVREEVIKDTFKYVNNGTFKMNMNFIGGSKVSDQKNQSIHIMKALIGFYIIVISIILVFNSSFVIYEMGSYVYNRILMTNISQVTYFLSNIISTVVMGLFMMWPMFFILNKVVHMGIYDFMYLILLITLYFSTLAIIYLVVANLVKNTIIFQSFMPLVILILSVLGMGVKIFPEPIKSIGKISPNYNIIIGIDAIINYDFYNKCKSVLQSLIVILAYVFVVYILKYIIRLKKNTVVKK